VINAPSPHPTVRVVVVACAGVPLFAARAASQTVGITTMLPFDYGVTGIRADDGDDVVITKGTGLPNRIQPTPAFIY
jgi:hypothetical protein